MENTLMDIEIVLCIMMSRKQNKLRDIKVSAKNCAFFICKILLEFCSEYGL